jgi:hypothetical protein
VEDPRQNGGPSGPVEEDGPVDRRVAIEDGQAQWLNEPVYPCAEPVFRALRAAGCLSRQPAPRLDEEYVVPSFCMCRSRIALFQGI